VVFLLEICGFVVKNEQEDHLLISQLWGLEFVFITVIMILNIIFILFMCYSLSKIVCIKYNKETSCSCLQWHREGAKGERKWW
jgi:flagellar biogenesis protein FliO